MISRQPICVLDSGIGGLPYLETMRAYLPNERFLYFSDTAGFPYGEKTSRELNDRLAAVLHWIIDNHQPKACVLACNTASVVALQNLRAAFPGLPFVGVVPAIKPAALITEKSIIGVLATQRTVEDAYLQGLIKSFAHNVQVETVGAGELVRFIEQRLYLPEDPRELLLPFAQRLTASNVDVVVLGCTHFLHIADVLAELLGDNIRIVDSRDGVAKQLARIIIPSDEPADPGSFVPWFTTAGCDDRLRDELYRRFMIAGKEIKI